MLDKTGVQLPRWAAALAPVEDEFRYGIFDELAVYAGAQHDLHGVSVGTPLVVERTLAGLEGFTSTLLFPAPAAEHVLTELVFPGVTGLAALAPVEDEIFQLIERELSRYVVVEGEQLKQVFAGCPAGGQESGAQMHAGLRCCSWVPPGPCPRFPAGNPARCCRWHLPEDLCPLWIFVEGEGEFLPVCIGIEKQYALCRKAGTDALQVVLLPEWQLAQQPLPVRAHPVAVLAAPYRRVLEQLMKELQ